MQILRTTARAQQIQEASALRSEILQKIEAEFPDVLLEDNPTKLRNHFGEGYSTERRIYDHAIDLYRTVEHSAESFDLILESKLPSEIDRTASMLFGPFFTSLEFPVPTDDGEMLFPIVQIDLQAISELTAIPLGDGLLQLWHQIDKRREEIVLIPRKAVSLERITNFPDDLPPMEFPVDASYSRGDEVEMIVGLESKGFQCQDDCRVLVRGLLEKGISPELQRLLERFGELVFFQDSMHMFGTFYPIQYSDRNFDGKCLFNINDWGSQGNAQLLYHTDRDSGDVSFDFLDSVR